MKRVVCTGGGTAGHVMPLLPVMDELRACGHEVYYIGSAEGPEGALVARHRVSFFAVKADKLRRYASWRTLLMPFNVLRGFAEALTLLRRLDPHLVLSKGGFVAVPVLAAAAFLRIPIVAHESDISPGLATRLTQPFAKRLCITLPPEVTGRAPGAREVVTGLPLRTRFLSPDPQRAEREFQLTSGRPLIVAFGGSLGSEAINAAIRAIVPLVTRTFQVVHICGRNRIDGGMTHEHYRQLESVEEGMADLMARADVIISRAGMTSLYETLTLRKSAVVIPLPRSTSRGDQIENAALLEGLGLVTVLDQSRLGPDTLHAAILDAYNRRARRAVAIGALPLGEGTPAVVRVVQDVLDGKADKNAHFVPNSE